MTEQVYFSGVSFFLVVIFLGGFGGASVAAEREECLRLIVGDVVVQHFFSLS